MQDGIMSLSRQEQPKMAGGQSTLPEGSELPMYITLSEAIQSGILICAVVSLVFKAVEYINNKKR